MHRRDFVRHNNAQQRAQQRTRTTTDIQLFDHHRTGAALGPFVSATP